MALFSKLDAVNVVLSGIGEDPVSSLSSGLADAEAAERCLDETSLDVQESGWHCNRETVTLSRDGSNNIQIPVNAMRVDTVDEHAGINVSVREGRLYDLDNATFVFSKDLKCEIVYHLEFSELPYRLAYYIAWEAAGRYQMRSMGSSAIEGWITNEITKARAKLDDHEAEVDDANILRDSRSVALITYRNNRIRGR